MTRDLHSKPPWLLLVCSWCCRSRQVKPAAKIDQPRTQCGPSGGARYLCVEREWLRADAREAGSSSLTHS